MTSHSVIVVDWGSTRGRAWLVNEGQVTETEVWGHGILFASVSDKRAFLAEQLSPLIELGRPDRILGVGMLGSRDGIQEVPYCSVPAQPGEWLDRAVPGGQIAGVDLLIFPGLSTGSSLFGLPSVMRGEEYELFSSDLAGSGTGMVVFPGTHSKWLEVRDGAVHNFETFPTGEMFQQWTTSSALSPLLPPEGTVSADGFRYGLARAQATAPLGPALFSLRPSVLSGDLSPEDLRGAISGVLIGSEIGRVLQHAMEFGKVLIGGALEFFDLYAEGLSHGGVDAERLNSSAVTLVEAWKERSGVRSTR